LTKHNIVQQAAKATKAQVARLKKPKQSPKKQRQRKKNVELSPRASPQNAKKAPKIVRLPRVADAQVTRANFIHPAEKSSLLSDDICVHYCKFLIDGVFHVTVHKQNYDHFKSQIHLMTLVLYFILKC
jgi:hypothetical protein